MLRSPLNSRRLAALVVLAGTGLLGIAFAARSGGATAAILAGVALVCAAALVARLGHPASEDVDLGQVFDVVLLALPAALTVYLSFHSGGYFPNSPALAALLLVVVLVLRITLVEEPLAGASRGLAAAAVALGLLALWALVSAVWSNAPGRALVEFDRAFAYLVLLVLVGSVPRTSMRLRWLAGCLALGILAVAVAALATRLAPDHFPTSLPAIGESNLAYPLTYSNALGILCVLGGILAMYFATSARLPAGLRVAGAAALPPLATTVYLTLSRGPVAAAIVGVAAFVLLGRPRGLLTGAAAAVPASVIAVASAYQHPLLTSSSPTSGSAVTQGHRVALVLAACTLGAAVLRALLVPVDRRLSRFSLPDSSRRPVTVGAWAALVVALLAVALAVNAPSRISDQYHRFVRSGQAAPMEDVRQSVFSSSNRGLVDNWRVALDAFKDTPLHGQGAGAYEVYWNQHRPAKQSSYNVVDAHSLYVEVLGELGIVGFLLLVTVIVAVLVALAPVRRGANRPLYAALFATALAWAVHAGVDWDWEMPAVTIPFFALGAAGLARHIDVPWLTSISQGARVGIGLLLLAGVITPALVFTSQRQLNDGRDALRAGNCGRAIGRSTASIQTLSVRSEPYELLAICQAKRGRTGFAIQAMAKAVHYDPDNWRYHYELGALQGGAGINPRPQLLAAKRLNPSNPDVKALLAEAPPGTAVNWDIELAPPGGALGAAQR